MGESGMDRLPEGCVAHAIALTSPRDVCRFSAVSSAFRSAAAYDTVWDRFLPSDYRSILSRAVRPVVCSSKRDLFFRLCDSLLIDAGKMDESGTKLGCCLMLAELLVGEVEWGQVLHALRPIAVHYVGRHAPVLEVGSSVRLQVLGGRRTGKRVLAGDPWQDPKSHAFWADDVRCLSHLQTSGLVAWSRPPTPRSIRHDGGAAFIHPRGPSSAK
uniref:F-box domain-containing protein n=1 Tax=Musa acuminata subsp. malaccensis TaxID=214687 RepID=A0A804JQ87_MUSAM